MPELTDLEERLLVLAPTGRDGPLTCRLLERAGLHAHSCADMVELCREADAGAAGLLLAEEALTSAATGALTALIARQPHWSDLPILLFMAHWEGAHGRLGHPRGSLGLIEGLGNVTVMDRPLRPVSMVSAARAALRARRRQYATRDALERQAELVQARDRFLAMLSHELRNPLSTLMLAAGMLERTGDIATHVPIIRRQGRNLTRLVDDLLEVARVTRGKVVLHREFLDLGEVLRRAVAGAESRSGDHVFELHLPPGGRKLAVNGDALRLEQVFGNLLTNAIKFTPAGGRIVVRVEARGPNAVVTVCDEGVGIPAEVLPRIFDLFAQGDDTLQRSLGGLGIGLTLVRGLVELHGGSVFGESGGDGAGSTFTVRLPLYHGELVDEMPAPPEVPRGEARKVLIIEDVADTRELMCALVEDFGHVARVAADGEAGVAAALADPPDVMLVDIGLPRLDGYGVARAVRAALGAGVLLVAVTGYGQVRDRERALEAGFDLHLTKPVDIEELQSVLARRGSGL